MPSKQPDDASRPDSQNLPDWPPISPFYPSYRTREPAFGTNRLGLALGLLLVTVAAGGGLAWVHMAREQASLQSEIIRLQSEVMLLSARAPTAHEGEASPGDVSSLLATPAIAGKVPLSVLSTPPGASVMIDGVTVGTTPLLSHYLDPGAYIVRATNEGASKEQVVVVLANDGPQTVSFDLPGTKSSRNGGIRQRRPAREREATASETTRRAPPRERNHDSTESPVQNVNPATPNGQVAIGSSPAGAEVRLSGRQVGTTPVDVHDLAPGTYTVTVEKDGHERWTSRVRVEANQRVAIHAELTPKPRKTRLGW